MLAGNDDISMQLYRGATETSVNSLRIAGLIMKIGIVGAGRVGCACALATVARGSARAIVIVDRTRARAKAVATDLRYGTPLGPKTNIVDGDYEDLADAALVMITAGINEKTGGATDRNDPQGRLRLLEKNAEIYRDIVPRVVRAAPRAVILVVTDPPDPLADIARHSAGHERVLSTGTFLDSLRFRVHLAEHFEVDANQVEGQVIGEHGVSQVFLWSSARIAGVPINKLIEERGETLDKVREQIEKSVRYANITIIEGNDASQFGIGIVSARIAEMVLRDERAVIPIGSYQEKFGVTLSLPSIVGRDGVVQTFEPEMSREEQQALELGAANLRKSESRT
jgi:L-lactate dehydrogenase